MIHPVFSQEGMGGKPTRVVADRHLLEGHSRRHRWSAIVVPTYKGKRQADAVAWFKADAADLFREEDVGRAGRAGRGRCRER